MADRRIAVPRVGQIQARPTFRVVASMNPYDNIGTTRLSTSVHDRFCRLAIGYQDAAPSATSSPCALRCGPCIARPIVRLYQRLAADAGAHPRHPRARGHQAGVVGAGAIDLTLTMPSGARKILWCHASPLCDADGNVRGAVGAYQDITTSRQRAEAALRESEERFRNTADAAPVIMRTAIPQKRITFFNKQTPVFTGLPVEQLLGDGWEQMIHPDELEAARQDLPRER